MSNTDQMSQMIKALQTELKQADERATLWRDRSDLIASKLAQAEYKVIDLQASYIECRDALACAMEWLNSGADEIPAETLKWLDERLLQATILADKLAAELDKPEAAS